MERSDCAAAFVQHIEIPGWRVSKWPRCPQAVPVAPLIEVQNLSRPCRTERALDQVGFDIRPKYVRVFFCPQGCGKAAARKSLDRMRGMCCIQCRAPHLARHLSGIVQGGGRGNDNKERGEG